MSKRSILGASVLTAALLAVAPAVAAPPAPTYIAMAGASDMYEIRSSKLVLASTKNPQLKSFAQQMITDHTKSTDMVKTAAQSSGMTPKPPMLMSKQQADLSALTAAKGMDRDQLYITQQKQAHQDALALQQDYASTGDTPALKDVAAQIVPVVQGHISMLQSM